MHQLYENNTEDIGYQGYKDIDYVMQFKIFQYFTPQALLIDLFQVVIHLGLL